MRSPDAGAFRAAGAPFEAVEFSSQPLQFLVTEVFEVNQAVGRRIFAYPERRNLLSLYLRIMNRVRIEGERGDALERTDWRMPWPG